jgi:hypothetical protein
LGVRTPKRSRISSICFSIVKNNYRVWVSFSMFREMFRDRLPEVYPTKNYLRFCLYYYEIIIRNFVKIYGFKNITGTSSFFANFGNFSFFQKISYRSSGKWYKLHEKFPKFCENFNYGLFWYLFEYSPPPS